MYIVVVEAWYEVRCTHFLRGVLLHSSPSDWQSLTIALVLVHTHWPTGK